MTSINGYLLSMASRNASTYARNPDVAAIVVVGSVGQGRAGKYSDIDTVLIYEKPPARSLLERAMKENGGECWQILSEDENGFLDTYRVNGVECQFSHGLTSWYESILKAVLEDYSTDRVHHLVLSGLRGCLPLYGKEFMDRMKARINEYPRELSVTLVREHLKFPPIDELRYRTMEEESLVRYYDILTKITTGVLGVFCGLNRIYMPRHFGKMHSMIEKMELKPDNFYERLNSLFTTGREATLAEINKLVLETAAIVETHLPEVDVESFRKSYLTELRPISVETES